MCWGIEACGLYSEYSACFLSARLQLWMCNMDIQKECEGAMRLTAKVLVSMNLSCVTVPANSLVVIETQNYN